MTGEKNKDDKDDQGRIRRYLLGAVRDETELEQIEKKLMSDDRYYEELQFQEEELIDDYLDKKLGAEELRTFEEQLLRSERLGGKLRFAKGLRDRVRSRSNEEGPKPSPIRSSAISRILRCFAAPIPALAALAVVLCGIGLWTWFGRGSDTREGMAALNRAYRVNRPLQARITELNYAPFSNTRGGPSAEVDLNERNKAELLLLNEVSRSRTPESLLALGRLYLAKGSVDEAISQLQNAEQLAPDNARIQNDLGAALLERSRNSAHNSGGEGMLTGSKALEKFERAIELDPGLLDAYFNKALCLQNLSLKTQAAKAWQDYLDRDAASPWAEEARRNLEFLKSDNVQLTTGNDLLQQFIAACERGDERAANSIQSRNREMITGKLVPQQVVFMITEAGKTDRPRYLSASRCAGRLDRQNTGDPFFGELSDYYSKVGPQTISKLGEAHSAVKQGYELSTKTSFSAAREEFERARGIYAALGDEWESLLCDYWIAYSDYQIDKVGESSDRLTRVAVIAEKRNYHWLAAQVYYWLSINSRTQNEHTRAFRFVDQALEAALRTGDNYSIQKTYSWRADARMRVRQTAAAAADLQSALEFGSASDSSPRQKWRDLDVGSQLFQAMKLHHTAAAFAEEAQQLNADAIHDLSYERVTSARLARILGSLKRFDVALELTERSKRAAEKIQDPNNSRKGIAFAWLQQGGLDREKGDFASSAAAYTNAIDIYDSMEVGQYNYEARKGRLLCRLLSGDGAAFDRELPDVLRLFEENRSRILEEQNRNSFFSDEQSVYDLAIGREVERGDFETAFEYSERSRSRSLLDLMSRGEKRSAGNGSGDVVFEPGKVFAPLGPTALRLRVPNQAQIVEYSVLSDRVVIWLVSRDKFEGLSVKLTSEELSNDVDGFLKAIASGEDVAYRSDQLYQTLIAPVETMLDPAADVFIVPDKALFRVPFAALSTNGGTYLVSRFRVSISPSANVFVLSSETARLKKPNVDEKLLSIGDPAFDQSEFPGLAPLPAAAREAAEISRLYDDHTLLISRTATRDRILEEMGKADVVHFAAHYQADPSSPLKSAFAVAGPGEESRLFSNDLLRENVSRPRMVILSGCETAVETYFDGEGMIGAGRTLLAAGVPVVVASQWKVDSDATAELMENFHRFRRTEKMRIVEALRRAQLGMLHGSNIRYRQPAYWAGFTVFGGFSEF